MSRILRATGALVGMVFLTTQSPTRAQDNKTNVFDLNKKADMAASYAREVGGRPLSEWITDLKNIDPSVRERALRAIPLGGYVSFPDDEDQEDSPFRGDDPHLLRNRPLDVWMHEQDVRRAVGRPGGLDTEPARHTAEYLAESLGFVLAKKVGAEPGTTLVLEMEGSEPFAFTVEIGRAHV